MKKTFLLLYFCCINYAVFALATLGNVGGTLAAGTICVPATKAIIAEFTVTQTVANTTLNTLNFTTTGTYVAADITDFKLYANITNTFGTAIQVGTTLAAGLGAGAHSFTALGSPLISGQTFYVWIVADMPGTATACNTIAVSAFTNANIVVAAGGTAGSTAASGVQTINKIPVITATAAPTPLCVGANLTLTGTGVACNNYSWSGPGGYSSALLSPGAFAVSIANAGIFTLSATNACGTTTANTASVVVNSGPTAVTATAAPNPVCSGSNLTLTGTATGATTYAWAGPAGSGYSSAVLNPPAFVASALDAGIFTLTATTAAGCTTTASTAAVVVNSKPTGVTASAAPNPVCVGANLTLTGTGVGGTAPVYTWTGPGISPLTGLTPAPFVAAATNAGIFTLTGVVAGCANVVATTASVVVNAAPTAVTATAAPNPACIGSNLTLTGTATGATTYLWTGPAGSGYSSAVLNPPAIVVSALDAGIFTLTATSAVGCKSYASTASVTVGGAVSPITGTASVCANSTTALSDISIGGVWSSSATGTATVVGGLVTGIAPGVATISYTLGGCSATDNVTVLNAPPAPLVAPHIATICNSGNLMITATEPTLPDTVLFQNFNTGTAPWTIDNTGSIATVGGTGWRSCGDGYINEMGTYHSPDNSGFAMVNSDTSGAASTTVSKLISNSFSLAGYSAATISFQVAYLNYAPGDQNVELDISSDGGVTWSVVHDYKTAGVSVGSTAAFVTQTYSLGAYLGLPNLMARFYYKSAYGWYFAVDNIAITGTPMVLATTWSPVTDLFTDAAFTIPYTAGTVIDTVYAYPTTVMVLTNRSYLATNTFGTCTASDSSQVTIQPNPVAISGTDSVCVGATTALSDATGLGSWSSSNTVVATIDAVTGLVTGVATGMDTITYSVGSCFVTVVVTVNGAPNPGIISGLTNICIGNTATLLDGVAGGVWSVSNSSASITDSGYITGLAIGIDTVSYLITNACGVSLTNFTDTISAAANSGFIVGPGTVCAASFALLTDTASGGTWSSSNATGTITSTGLFSAMSTGIDTVYYTVITQCSTSVANKIITIMPLPDTGIISGLQSVCVGSTITLVDTVAGGIWSSTADATVSATGVVTGVTAGIDTVYYSVSNSCGALAASWIITVNPIGAGIISGPANVCVGSLINLTSSVPFGIFSSGNLNATTTSGGQVTGSMPGADTITYTVVSVCGAYSTTKVITVQPLPNAGIISGLNVVCANATITLTDSVAGGKWTSDDNAIATVDSTTGVVTGVSGATVNINYFVTSAFGCVAETSYPITVNPAPPVNAITGITNECVGATTTLADITPSGIWSCSDATKATIDASGVVMGIAGGIVNISYSVTDMLGCIGSAVVADTVNQIPTQAPITGNKQVCIGATTTLSDTILMGVWASSDTTIAIVGTSTGIVTGIIGGSVLVYYSVSNMCGSVIDTTIVTVNSLPTVAAISGPSGNICAGSTDLVTDATTGGAWSSSNTAIATVNSSTGWVTGISAGMATITYTVTNDMGCSNIATLPITFAGSLSASIYPTGVASLCHSTHVYMHITASGTGITYQWLRDNVIIAGATNYYYNAPEAGTYSAIVGNSTCTETIAGPTVVNAPHPIISLNAPDLLYTGSFLTYEWLWNGSPIAGANTSIHIATKNGSYNVVVSDANGCVDTSASYVINNIVSEVNTVINTDKISIYPNPATSVINIDAPQLVNVKILSPDGKVIIAQNNTKQVNVASLANGLYFIELYDTNQILLKTAKFTKL